MTHPNLFKAISRLDQTDSESQIQFTEELKKLNKAEYAAMNFIAGNQTIHKAVNENKEKFINFAEKGIESGEFLAWAWISHREVYGYEGYQPDRSEPHAYLSEVVNARAEFYMQVVVPANKIKY